MKRRDFLEQVALYAAGAVAIAPIFDLDLATADAAVGNAAGAGPTLVVGKGEDYPKLVRAVIEKLGGLKPYIKPEANVVIKPNIGWDRNPEQAANTHPLVVQTLALLAVEAGAGKVQIFDRTCNAAARCYQNSGIKPAIDALNDKRIICHQVDDARFIPVQIKQGQKLEQWDLYQDALQADCYINVPIPKNHGATKLSLGLKNIMGVCGGNRGQLHKEIVPKLVDINTVLRTHLTVIDATRILLRGGPSGGKLEDVKVLHTLIASTDPVAADAYATTLFGMQPKDIPLTVQAAQRGLGEMDLAKVNVIEA